MSPRSDQRNVLLAAQLIDLSSVLELDNYHLHTRSRAPWSSFSLRPVLRGGGGGGEEGRRGGGEGEQGEGREGRFSFDRQLAQSISQHRGKLQQVRHFSASFRSICRDLSTRHFFKTTSKSCIFYFSLSLSLFSPRSWMRSPFLDFVVTFLIALRYGSEMNNTKIDRSIDSNKYLRFYAKFVVFEDDR